MRRLVLTLSFFAIIFSIFQVKAADFCDNQADITTLAQEIYNLWEAKVSISKKVRIGGVDFVISFDSKSNATDISPGVSDACYEKVKAKFSEIFNKNTNKTPVVSNPKKCVLCVYDYGGSSYLSGETGTVVGENNSKISLNAYCKSKTTKEDCPSSILVPSIGGGVPACRWQESTSTCISYFLTSCVEELKNYADDYTKVIINDDEKEDASAKNSIKNLDGCTNTTFIKSGHGEVGGVVAFGDRIIYYLIKNLPKFRPITLNVFSGGCSDFDINCRSVNRKKGVCEKVTYYASQVTVAGGNTVIPNDPDNPGSYLSVSKHKKVEKTYDKYGNPIIREQLPNCEGRCMLHIFDNFSKFKCVKDKSKAFSKWYSEADLAKALSCGDVREIMCCPKDGRSGAEWTEVGKGSQYCPGYDQNKVLTKGSCMADFEHLSILTTDKPISYKEGREWVVSDQDIANAKLFTKKAVEESVNKCLDKQKLRCEENLGYKFSFNKQDSKLLDPLLDYFIGKDNVFRKLDEVGKTYTLNIYPGITGNKTPPPTLVGIPWECKKS